MEGRGSSLEGKTQSLSPLSGDPETVFRRYKARLASVNHLNPGITDAWMAALTFKVEI